MEHAGEDKRKESLRIPDNEKSGKRRPKKNPAWLALPILLTCCLTAIYVKFLSPEALVKRAFFHGVAAFELKDSKKLMDFISDSYSDSSGNTKPIIETTSGYFLSNYDKIKVKINRLDIKMTVAKHARLTIEGKVFFTKGETTFYTKSEEPVTFTLIRENDRHWRLASIEGADISLNSIETDLL
jgi:hypothetical protein